LEVDSEVERGKETCLRFTAVGWFVDLVVLVAISNGLKQVELLRNVVQ
jgi:hypothetical protein